MSSSERRAYNQFRTGLTFSSVRRMLFVNTQDRSKWRNKRRHTVLGFWHRLKLDMWEQLTGGDFEAMNEKAA